MAQKKGKFKDWVTKVFKIHKETSAQDVRRSGSNLLEERPGNGSSFYNGNDDYDTNAQLKRELEDKDNFIKNEDSSKQNSRNNLSDGLSLDVSNLVVQPSHPSFRGNRSFSQNIQQAQQQQQQQQQIQQQQYLQQQQQQLLQQQLQQQQALPMSISNAQPQSQSYPQLQSAGPSQSQNILTPQSQSLQQGLPDHSQTNLQQIMQQQSQQQQQQQQLQLLQQQQLQQQNSNRQLNQSFNQQQLNINNSSIINGNGNNNLNNFNHGNGNGNSLTNINDINNNNGNNNLIRNNSIGNTNNDGNNNNNNNNFNIQPSNNGTEQLEQLVQVLTCGQEQDKARAVEILFNLSTEEKLDKQKLAQLGVVEPLIKLLYSETELATLYASYMLNNLTSIEISRNDMNDYGAIKALLYVLTNEKKSLVSKKGAMRALGRLARIQEQAQEIVSQGGLETIINVLQMEDNSLVKRTLIALYFIGADKQQLQTEIAETKAIQHLLKLARHENSEIQAEACDCIKVLSRNVECARVIISNQGLAILGDMANGQGSNNKAKQSAHKALQRLSEIQEIKEQVIQTVGKLQPEVENENEGNEVEQVVYLMTKGNPFIQIQTAQQIAHAASEDPKISKSFADQGVVLPLINMVKSGDMEQKVSASQALAKLALDQSVSLQIYKSGIFPKLVQTLKQTQGQRQEGAAACIDRIIGIKGAIQDLNDIVDGFQTLMDTLDSGTPPTQSHMARVLYLCAADPNCCRCLLQPNNLSIIMRQCWRAKQDTKVFCLSTIQDLIRQQPDSCSLIVQIGIIPVLYHLSQHRISKIATSSQEILKILLRQNPQYQQQLQQEVQYQDWVRKLLTKLDESIRENAPNFKKEESQEFNQDSFISPVVEEVFLTIPRHIFISQKDASDISQATQEVTVTLPENKRLTVPPAWVDALAIMALHVLPGESVFDVGSGSGFMTAAFAYLTGQKGSVTASEVSNPACEYAGQLVTYALQTRALSSCSPIILPQNVFVLLQQIDNLQKQDKIYVGASCPSNFIPLFLNMLKPNGRLVIPCDGQLLQITKTRQGDQVRELCAFSPASLQIDGQALQQQPNRNLQQQPKDIEQVDINQLEQQLKQQPQQQRPNAQDENNNQLAQFQNRGGGASNGAAKSALENAANRQQSRQGNRSSANQSNRNSKDQEKEKIDKEIKQGMQEGLLMTIDEIEVIRNQDGKKCKLGEGGFGVVYKAAMNGVDEVAVKIVKADNPSPKELELFLKEVKTLSKLHHRNIVQFYGVCLDIGSLFFVMELMKGGDLYTVLRHHPDTMRWDKLGRKVALDVALGINYLHTRRPPMMHRDLKSPNVLLSEEGVAKIADVGMVRQQVKDLVTAQPVMTPLWAAPEVMRHEKASVKADIWSYGILIWEIVTGQDITDYQPLGITKLAQQSQTQQNRGKIMTLPPNCSPAARKVFEACTHPDPKRRPSAQYIVGWLKEEVT